MATTGKKGKEIVNEETGEIEGAEPLDGEVEGVTDTSLITTDDGAMSYDMMDDLVDAGFKVVKTLKAGNPKTGCVPNYCGMVIAKGAPVQAKLVVSGKEVSSDIATFAIHPAIPKRGSDGSITLIPNRKVTVRLIAPTQLAGDLDSLLIKSSSLGRAGLFAYRWKGKMDIKGGNQQLNNFDFIEYLSENTAENAVITLQPINK